jgi:hypothetical protein
MIKATAFQQLAKEIYHNDAYADENTKPELRPLTEDV